MTEKIQALQSCLAAYNREAGERIRVRIDEPLRRHTTFRIGGAADLYLEPCDETALAYILCKARELGVRVCVIGRGSNLLFSDGGFRGAVISTAAMRAVHVEGTTVIADAGATMASVANAALDAGLTGLEFAHGIPGSLGGAVFMNAGAYDGEIAGVLMDSRYLDSETGAIASLNLEGHQFGYRDSSYRHERNRVILSARFALTQGEPDAIRGKMAELMRRRMEKQPLEYPSAGSTFKRYPGRYTAQMIDEAGLKGFACGGAQVSEKHAGFIINRGGATAADVTTLIAQIQTTIQAKFGILIEPEIVIVPEK